MTNKNSEYYFLKGGGEMGALIRAKDWSKTSLGNPADWPQSLRTMVAVMLDNPFGMYIAWGSEYIQLYNDGYRPILGSTKHPHALGISTRETFSEIWDSIIGSMFDGVMKGEAVGYPDLMLPLNRNGFVEECYFDFAYSPIRKDNGEVGGVLVTVIETTDKKKGEVALLENSTQLKFAMDAAELGAWDYNPSSNKFTANNRLKTWFGLSASEEIELHHATDAIAEKDRDRIIMAIKKVLDYSSGGIYEEEYSIINPLTNKEIIVQAKGRVWFNDEKIAYRFNGILQEVTENVLARKKIEESELLFKLAIAGSNQIVFSQDKNLIHTWIYNHHPDFKQDEIIGKTDNDLHVPESAAVLTSIKQKVLDTGNTFNGDIEIEIGNKKENYTLHIEAMKDSEENITGIIGSSIDITERIKIEQRIKESDDQFITLADNMGNLAWLADNEGSIYWYNKRWYEYTGLTLEEMKGWGWQKVHHPDHVERIIEFVKNAWYKNETFELTFPLKRYDGEYRWFLTRGYPVVNDEGKIVQWIGTNTDITEQKEAEEQFRQMAERMPQKVWTADAQGNRNYFNDVMLNYTGVAFEELKDWGWEKIIHPDDWPKTKQKWEHSINTGEDYENENRLLRNDGTYLWHLVRATAVKDENNNPKIWIGSSTEIQEQVELSNTLNENLKESNKRMQTILHHAPDAVISIDEDGVIQSWNSEAEIIFGWREDEVIKKTLTETIIPKRYRGGHDNGMKHFLKTGEGPVINKPVELSAIRKDGTEFPVELKISTTKINDKHIFIGFIRDISIRKEAEETIKNKTNQLMEAQQLAHIGSWEWDVRSNRINWSDELYRIFGLTAQEFEADYDNFLKYIHPDDKEYVNSLVQKAFNDHLPFKFFHKTLSPNGNVRIISATGKVFTDEAGNVIKMSGTAQDVTSQKKYEEELKTSEESFFKIFDSNPIPMTLSEIKTNKIKYANNLFYNAFGYTKEEVIGNSSEDLNLIDAEEYQRVINLIFGYIHENRSLEEVQALSTEETENLLLKLKQSEKMKDFEISYTRKNGETFPALVSFELIKIGTETYTVTSYQDITIRKKAEAKLISQNDQLEKMNKELESFAYISSHDLQEPLRKIQTFASRIKEKEENNLSDYGKDMFSRMQAAAKRMQTLIQDLLAYSRTNTTDRIFETTDLNEIIAEVKEELKEELQEKHAIIEANQLCDAKIIPFQFRQLLHNLIGNSLKFSKPNQLPLIQIKSEIATGINLKNEHLSPQNKYCHITVSDNGIGFEEQYNEKIFEVFQRLHGKNEYNGTGIGLSIVKKIVENHEGIVIAKGQLNKGAIFEIYIPAT